MHNEHSVGYIGARAVRHWPAGYIAPALAWPSSLVITSPRKNKVHSAPLAYFHPFIIISKSRREQTTGHGRRPLAENIRQTNKNPLCDTLVPLARALTTELKSYTLKRNDPIKRGLRVRNRRLIIATRQLALQWTPCDNEYCL
ncbi:unnamed protein product [Plutella xylostella]|uniref:(diamondback moth) hypothetical protein n=1 Tax=Plutella xylostella TaxID=51655 RepID=A0A8S4G5M8_PLUXY|nr:unnamed protein product [Plutella xylostella]